MSRRYLTPILLPADPAVALEAATKQYVDAKGAAASSAGSFFNWTWSSTTTAPPAAGTIRYNNATLASVTTVWIYYVTTDTIDTKTRLLNGAKAGAQIYVQDKDVSANYHTFNITGPAVDNTTYAAIPVTFASSGGTITNNQAVLAGLLQPALALPVSVANGGTGTSTLTGLVKGNGTSAFTAAVAGTDYATAAAASGAGGFFGFDFDTTTTAGPAATRLRLNNATAASVTAVYIAYTSKDNVDLKTRLLAGTAGDRVFMQERINSANYRLYELTGAPTDNTTYATCPVVHRASGGTLGNAVEIVAGYTSAPFTVASTAPSAPVTGDLWVDTS